MPPGGPQHERPAPWPEPIPPQPEVRDPDDGDDGDETKKTTIPFWQIHKRQCIAHGAA